MASTRTYLQDVSTRHSVFVQRFAGSQLKEMIPYLQRVKRTTAGALAGKNLTTLSRKRLNALYEDIDGKLMAIYNAMGKKVRTNLKPFAVYEVEFTERMLSKALDIDFAVPGRNQIYAAVFSDPLVLLNDGRVNLDSALAEFSEKKTKQIIQVVKDAVIIGKSHDQIVQDIAYVTDKIQANHARALSRTLTSHISSVAKAEVFRNNEDILEGEEWVSTLDSATTIQCASLDGTRFDGPADGPQPPLHWNCRSIRIPIVKPQYTVQPTGDFTRPAVGADGPEQDNPLQTTYNSWLKRQPASFQDEVLGKARGELFRSGNYSVKDFVDENYQIIKLSDLPGADKISLEK